MKQPPKQPWYARFYEAYRIMFMVFGFGILFNWGLIVGTHFYDQHIAKYFDKSPELSPGELVDKAMAIPGAIVISPHRDLASLGIAVQDKPGDIWLAPEATTAGPAIAVKTMHKWCVWSLSHQGIATPPNGSIGMVNTHSFMITGSYNGYQAAYDSFTKCVAEGNAPVWHKVGKVVPCEDIGGCGMKDDPKAFEKAARFSALSQTTTAQWDYKKTSGRSCDCDTITSAACANICHADHSEGIE